MQRTLPLFRAGHKQDPSILNAAISLALLKHVCLGQRWTELWSNGGSRCKYQGINFRPSSSISVQAAIIPTLIRIKIVESYQDQEFVACHNQDRQDRIEIFFVLVQAVQPQGITYCGIEWHSNSRFRVLRCHCNAWSKIRFLHKWLHAEPRSIS